MREADTQSQDLTTQLHRLENEKKELANRLGSLLSTLRRFVRVLDDGQNKTTDYRNSSRFLQELSIPHGKGGRGHFDVNSKAASIG